MILQLATLKYCDFCILHVVMYLVSRRTHCNAEDQVMQFNGSLKEVTIALAKHLSWTNCFSVTHEWGHQVECCWWMLIKGSHIQRQTHFENICCCKMSVYVWFMLQWIITNVSFLWRYIMHYCYFVSIEWWAYNACNILLFLLFSFSAIVSAQCVGLHCVQTRISTVQNLE